MTTYRLDSISPLLAESFRSAPALKRRRAARLASEAALLSVALTEQSVKHAIEVLRSGTHLRPELRAELKALAARFDDEYLRLDEEGGTEKSQVLKLFSKARAISALAFALSDNSAELHEAIYEAIAAMEDSRDLVVKVQHALTY